MVEGMVDAVNVCCENTLPFHAKKALILVKPIPY